MSAFGLSLGLRNFRRRGAATASVTYDTSIGNGVDSSGFASLPLKAAGTDGPDLITTDPTSLSGATWNSGTGTLTCTGAANFANWVGALSPYTSYHLTFSYTMSGGAELRVNDGSADVWLSDPLSASGTVDATFVTNSGSNFYLQASGATFTGTITNIEVRTNGQAARRFYVSSATGNDTRTSAQAQVAATPMASIAAALAFAQPGRGDQIMVAEGSSFAAGLPQINKSGQDPVYPLVIQSYDPADPTNEAKYGRATTNRPVLNTGATATQGVMSGSNASLAVQYVAIRGLKFDPGNVSGMAMTFLPINTAATNNYLLLENNIFAYTTIGIDEASASAQATHIIVRLNAFYGAWNSDPNVHAGGIYVAFANNVTLEDNTFYHNGWKIGAARGDSVASGGVTVFRHPVYLQDDTDATYRRNLTFEGCADGGSVRGNIDCNYNVVIDCPVGIGLGSGTGYDVTRPSGVLISAAYNTILGSSDLYPVGFPDGNGLRGWGLTSANGVLGSVAHHNLLARGTAGANSFGFETDAAYNQPSYMDYHDNVLYQWTVSGQTKIDTSGSFPAQIHASYELNYWDDPASGSNLNIASKTIPNAYTVATLSVALGYADKAAWIADAIAHPEVRTSQRSANSLLLAGYGV